MQRVAAIGMARQTLSGPEPVHPVPRRSPSLLFADPEPMVSLSGLKAAVQSLSVAHPLRILVLAEPDEIPRREYLAKVMRWFRLLNASV